MEAGAGPEKMTEERWGEISTADLIREALDESRALLKVEVALAREEMRREVKELTVTAVAAGAAAFFFTLAVAALLVSLITSIPPEWLTALIAGLILLGLAAAAGLVAYHFLPKKPMEKTKERLETDVHMLKERIA